MRKGKWSIPTTYNGVLYRSKLEADWSRFFDRHRMKYAYESEGFDLGGLWYLPDFYLPEIKTFVEVKGALDDEDEAKLFALARAAAPKGIMVILAEAPAGERYRLVHPTPQEFEMSGPEPGPYLDDEVALALCARCNTWYFVETMQSWHCVACGYAEGDQTHKVIHQPNPAQWIRAERCPDCRK